ncbi:MAG: ABC-F family ATP-binding cassette domain-containing protein [Planctomycetota bacterium]
MAALITVHELSKSFGDRTLFSGLTFSLHERERVGMIGTNGAGKSTLLRLLAGLEEPDEGRCVLAKATRLAYLPQEEPFPPERTVEELVLEALAGEPLDEVQRLTRAQIVIGKVGFEDPSQTAGTLSGGWRKRLSLARVLVLEPDVVLLDEPTNHLDVSGIQWLEKLLANEPFAWIVVTHDRYFLENATTHMLEIDRRYPDGFFKVEASYSGFLERREALFATQARQEASLRNRVRQEVAFLRSNVREQRTKSKHLVAKAHDALDELSGVKARNAERSLAGIEFASTGRKSKKLLAATKIAKALGERTLFSDLDLELGPGDRLGLVGDNGSGKTTLLRVLSKELEPDAGQVVHAQGLSLVSFSQHRTGLDPELTLRQALATHGDTVRFRGQGMHVVAWAKRFGFPPEQLERKVEVLSGGERARVLIADLVRQEADLLLLDEPTNDLDLQTREVLEEQLLEFPGAIVLVTHDRYMLDRVCTQVLGVSGDGHARLVADFRQWQRALEALRAPAPAPKQAPKPAVASKPQHRVRRLSNYEREELDGIEEAIAAAEGVQAGLQTQAEDPEVFADHDRMTAVFAELEAAQQEVERLYARWQELEAIDEAYREQQAGG